jgi:hypothetical protein
MWTLALAMETGMALVNKAHYRKSTKSTAKNVRVKQSKPVKKRKK